MNIFKIICNIFKKNETKKKIDNNKEFTDAEIISRSAKGRAIERVIEKRRMFPLYHGPGAFYHSSLMDDFDNEYDKAFTEVYNEYYGYSNRHFYD